MHSPPAEGPRQGLLSADPSTSLDTEKSLAQHKDDLQRQLLARLELHEVLLRNIQSSVDDWQLRGLARGRTRLNSGETGYFTSLEGGQSLYEAEGGSSKNTAFHQDHADHHAPPSPASGGFHSNGESKGTNVKASPPAAGMHQSWHTAEVEGLANGAREALHVLDPPLQRPNESEELAHRTQSTSTKLAWRRSRLKTSRNSSSALTSSMSQVFVSMSSMTNHAWSGLISLGCTMRSLCILVVLFDAAVMTVETNEMAKKDIDSNFEAKLLYVQVGVVAWYIGEIGLRLLVARPIEFFTSKQWGWNLFDLTVTVTSVLDLLLINLTIRLRALAVLRLLRLIRIIRLLRMLRIFRLMSFVREFHKLVLCLACSLQNLLPAMLLIGFVIFTVSMLLTQAVSSYLWDADTDRAIQEELRDGFGSVGSSMMSMYMAITSGKNWGEIYYLLESVNTAVAVFFFIFILVSIYGLTNVVTSVFVESAMQATQHYRDLLVQEMLMKEQSTVKHIKKIFQSIDKNKSGTITLEEMQAFLQDDSLMLQEYFEALNLSASSTETLFSLLDCDGSGEIDIDEFCDGCMRLGGAAKSFDMNCMWYEQRRINRELLQFIQHAYHGIYRLSKGYHEEAQGIAQITGRIEKMLERKDFRAPRNRGLKPRARSGGFSHIAEDSINNSFRELLIQSLDAEKFRNPRTMSMESQRASSCQETILECRDESAEAQEEADEDEEEQPTVPTTHSSRNDLHML